MSNDLPRKEQFLELGQKKTCFNVKARTVQGKTRGQLFIALLLNKKYIITKCKLLERTHNKQNQAYCDGILFSIGGVGIQYEYELKFPEAFGYDSNDFIVINLGQQIQIPSEVIDSQELHVSEERQRQFYHQLNLSQDKILIIYPFCCNSEDQLQVFKTQIREFRRGEYPQGSAHFGPIYMRIIKRDEAKTYFIGFFGQQTNIDGQKICILNADSILHLKGMFNQQQRQGTTFQLASTKQSLRVSNKEMLSLYQRVQLKLLKDQATKSKTLQTWVKFNPKNEKPDLKHKLQNI